MDIRTTDGMTAFMSAAKNNRLSTMRKLVCDELQFFDLDLDLDL